MASKRDRMVIEERYGALILDFGEMQIWDGADLCLLRETLTRLLREKQQTLGVDMSHVMYVPSGFFGMLLDCRDKGATVYVDGATPRVRNMLWFRQFFDVHEATQARFLLRGEPRQVPAPPPMQPSRNTDWEFKESLASGGCSNDFSDDECFAFRRD